MGNYNEKLYDIFLNYSYSDLQMKCAREAVKLIKIYISEEISFNQENTLSGKSIINNIKTAKQKLEVKRAIFVIKKISNFCNYPMGGCEN